ncbi:MAG: F0F1 ATP synthase subunit B' [Rhodoblastus sp.]|nr:MAG: F0F1 ATP synthase subunit B' [Rhodoblastus sp.]
MATPAAPHATPAPAAHGASTAAPAPGGHEAVFPPFDTATFAGQLLWLAIFFGLLYWLMAKIALPRVAGTLEARDAKISGDLKAAQAARDEADAARVAHEKTLADAKARSQAMAQEANAKAAAASDARRKSLTADLDAKLAESEKQIADMRARAMANVDDIARDAAQMIVRQLSGRDVSPEEAARAVASIKSA